MKRGGKFVAHKRPKGRVAVCRSDHIARPNACLQQKPPTKTGRVDSSDVSVIHTVETDNISSKQ